MQPRTEPDVHDQQQVLTAVAEQLRQAKALVVLTGAGVSAESGIPTFRDAMTGLWARYDPMQLATSEAFARDPELVWKWYQWRRELVAAAQPNPAHRAIADMEGRLPSFTLVTQNVDRLHQRAGSRRVIELHGNLAENRCSREQTVIPAEQTPPGSPPSCRSCGAPLRPNVVWFGEALPADALEEAIDAAHRCDLLICVGTSSLVYPAAALPVEAAMHGGQVVEINPDTTPLTPAATHSLRGKAGELLPRLVTLAFPAAAESGKST